MKIETRHVYHPDNKLNYDAEVNEEHVHTFVSGICKECGMHREEIFTTLSGVFPDEREQY